MGGGWSAGHLQTIYYWDSSRKNCKISLKKGACDLLRPPLNRPMHYLHWNIILFHHLRAVKNPVWQFTRKVWQFDVSSNCQCGREIFFCLFIISRWLLQSGFCMCYLKNILTKWKKASLWLLIFECRNDQHADLSSVISEKGKDPLWWSSALIQERTLEQNFIQWKATKTLIFLITKMNVNIYYCHLQSRQPLPDFFFLFFAP